MLADSWGKFPTCGRVNLAFFRSDERKVAGMRGFRNLARLLQ
jgi:hypothetical protein